MNNSLLPIVGGLNPTRTVLLRAIKLTANVNVQHAAEKYFKLFDKWTHCEGKRSALLRAKAIHHCAVNFSLNQLPPNYPFLKLTEGFPTAIIGLKKHCVSPEGIQATLSVTGHFRGILAPGEPDLTPITGEGKEAPSGLIDELCDQIPNNWEFDLSSLSAIHHEFRTRFGPNGQSLTSCALDVIALTKESKLMESLIRYYDFFDTEIGEDLIELSEICETKIKSLIVTSKIAVKKELGGKDRMFAMCDYWSQIALHPLHNKLASILKRLEADATFGQDTAAVQIKEWTKEDNLQLFSLDLKSATDRFPVAAIQAMIGKLTDNEEFGESWRDLIANRIFHFRGKEVKWSVGQPLGAYSSWPSFALCHHLVVKLAAKRARIKHPRYKILGDDIVIASKILTDHYITIMTDLGVEFSLSKSLSGVNRAEFAKRLFLKGKEVTPLPIKLIKESISNYLLTKTLYETLIQKTVLKNGNPSILSFNNLFKGFHTLQDSKKVALLISFPFKTESRINGSFPVTPWQQVKYPSSYAPSIKELTDLQPYSHQISLEELGLLSFFIRYRYIRDSYAEEMSKTDSFKKQLDTLKLPGITQVDRHLHPVYKSMGILANAQAKAHRALGSFWTEAKRKGANAQVPNVNLPDASVFKLKHRDNVKREAKVILHTYSALLKYGAWRVDNQAHDNPSAVIAYLQKGNML